MRRTATLLKTRPVSHQRLSTASAGLLKPSSAWAFLASRSYSSNVPTDLKYTKSHEWVRMTNGVATIGITDHAQEALGEVVFVDLPETGATYGQKESFGAVESVKTVSDIYAPVGGEVVEVNADLKDKGSVNINSDPYGNGWMVKLKVSNQAELNDLLDAKAYEEHCASEAH
ncbi:glycine cleavage system H protein [Acanthamoeba castellanii str. Neff]|uniref:Glycine cleavage system H protein n=1 Tax=Acanthamoeba castellanii (strain ATCC 30010 / Neff) TaxID=1257118 RepID=L8HGN1_ACACF|nr:glycine cleavage system H protein [Acanthamoeba castellanii str. Neff]ELR24699.1 glycine cleavage system H protein [Acanthamoeba castellanii str. Neff]